MIASSRVTSADIAVRPGTFNSNPLLLRSDHEDDNDNRYDACSIFIWFCYAADDCGHQSHG